jgi:hypothetical protein
MPGLSMRAPCTLHWLLVVQLSFLASFPAHGDDWIPISPDELKMTAAPKAPGASAIFLYRQVDRDDNVPSETNYERIKILTEEGRNLANIEIPFYKGTEAISGIQARTIHSDGTIVPFDGSVYEKSVLAASGVKLMAKTFTLPDVQVGSIIEYRYRHNLALGMVYDSHWILSQNLFTQSAKFSLDPYRGFPMRFSWPLGLPPDTEPPKDRAGKIRLETRDVPAFVTEEYMPPEESLKYRVDFIYEDDVLRMEKDPEVFWQRYAKRKYSEIEKFLDQRRVMTEAVAQIILPGDSQEEKLRKIYERTQKLRNLSFERRKSQQESDREKLKDAKDVADVWKNGYGDGVQITWLFLGLARACGIEAYPVMISSRENRFFERRIMNASDLNTNVVMVVLNGQELYMDPGTQFAPFGMLPWMETAVAGLRPEKGGGTWIHTPVPDAKESRTERNATFQLTANGDLEGTVTVTYTGQSALWRRQQERFEDQIDRKQFLEDQIKAAVGRDAVAELTNQPEWDSSNTSLVAVFDLTIPSWASAAGQRTVLLPVGIFGAAYKHTLQHSIRVHPIYFDFAHQDSDAVAIQLAPNWKITNSPQTRNQDITAFVFSSSSSANNDTLHLNRQLTINATLVGIQYYPALQTFFEKVRTADADQVILSPAKNHAPP